MPCHSNLVDMKSTAAADRWTTIDSQRRIMKNRRETNERAEPHEEIVCHLVNASA